MSDQPGAELELARRAGDAIAGALGGELDDAGRALAWLDDALAEVKGALEAVDQAGVPPEALLQRLTGFLEHLPGGDKIARFLPMLGGLG